MSCIFRGVEAEAAAIGDISQEQAQELISHPVVFPLFSSFIVYRREIVGLFVLMFCFTLVCGLFGTCYPCMNVALIFFVSCLEVFEKLGTNKEKVAFVIIVFLLFNQMERKTLKNEGELSFFQLRIQPCI